MLENKNTKENILQKLYNNATTVWGVSDVEDLDPLVRYLMGGFATLISDIHGELDEMNVRILESLANTLTPSVLTDPFPAHTVAHTTPIEPVFFLDRKSTFDDKRMSQELFEKGIKFLSFAPVREVRLVSGKIKYLICERNFYRIGEVSNA